MMLNKLIDDFINIYNNDTKQKDANWYKLMGTTVGGSEVAALMGLNPYSSFYKIVESKIEICKGNKAFNSVDTLSCWWGTIFENVITKVVEIDLGNTVKGSSICIQKYEGHRNSPDGYIVVNFYKKNDKYHIWTTDLPDDIIDLSLIMLLEFKCPITRKITGDIPKYYKPQVLSGLAVSPPAHKGLFVDAMFKKCSIEQLGNNPDYDTNFHKRTIKSCNPIVWGTITIYVPISKIHIIKDIYETYFGYELTNIDEIIDLGDIDTSLFSAIIALINDKTLLIGSINMHFADGRGDEKLFDLSDRLNCHVFAIFPWKLFDILYVPIDREPNFLENIYPLIQKVHELVHESITDNTICEKLKITNMCGRVYD